MTPTEATLAPRMGSGPPPFLPETELDRRLDLAGAVLLAGTLGWALLSATHADGSAAALVGLLVAATAAHVLARLPASIVHRLVLGAISLSGVLVVVFQGEPVGMGTLNKLGLAYPNARGAFLAQGGVAALMLGAVSRRLGTRILWWAVGALLLAWPFGMDTVAAAVLAVLVPGAALSALWRLGPRAAIAVCGGLFALALAGTLTVAASSDRGPTPRSSSPAARFLTERRVVLWNDALHIMVTYPLLGVGPGNFQMASPTARSDEDALWAHHEFLQQGAEMGIPGFAFLVLLFVWSFLRLASSTSPAPVRALGASAVAALGIHSSVDYVLHAPAVPIAAAALVGAALAARRFADARNPAGA
jgi:O-antigen ligase